MAEEGAAWTGELRTDSCTKGEAADWFRTDEYPGGVNEHWLYHGTSLEGEAGITEGDFRLNLAGSNAGTLYGAFLSFLSALEVEIREWPQVEPTDTQYTPPQQHQLSEI